MFYSRYIFLIGCDFIHYQPTTYFTYNALTFASKKTLLCYSCSPSALIFPLHFPCSSRLRLLLALLLFLKNFAGFWRLNFPLLFRFALFFGLYFALLRTLFAFTTALYFIWKFIILLVLRNFS